MVEQVELIRDIRDARAEMARGEDGMVRICVYALGLSLGLGVLDPVAGQNVLDLGELDPLVTFRLSESPLASIGERSVPEHELFQVRGAVTLSDGRIAVLNDGTHEIRIFSRDGDHIASWGRTGDGPGEFRSADRLFLTRDDSLAVWDARGGRASIFSTEEGFVRTISLSPSPPAARLEGVDEQGRMLIVAMRLDRSASPEIRRLPEDVFLYGPDGTRIDGLGEAPGMSGVIRSSGERVEVLRPLIAPTTTYAFGRDHLWIETGERPQVRVLDVASKGSRTLTWTGHDLTMTDARVEEIIQGHLDGADDPETRTRLRSSLEARPVPSSLPATERVLSDPAGRAWVQLAQLPGEDHEEEWMIFRPEGTVVARVRVPSGTDLQSISGNEVVVVERGELDIEYVRIYQLRRVEAP